jgi:hypothetical protein
MWLGEDDPRLEGAAERGLVRPYERVRALRAARPGTWLYHAHPAIGLDGLTDHVPEPLSDRRLRWRPAWRRRSPEEREQAELDFFLALLTRVADAGKPTFEVWIFDDESGWPPLRTAIEPHATSVEQDAWGLAVARGPLTAAAATALVCHEVDVLMVDVDGLLRVVVWGGWRATGVWLTEPEAAALRAQLATAADPPEPSPVRPLRPGARLHQVHPAIGVRRAGEHGVERLTDLDLGAAWLALSEAEQEERERDLLRELLVWAREAGALSAPEPLATDELMRADHRAPLGIRVRGQTLVESEGPRKTGAWVAPADAGALQQRLMDAWWEPWKRRCEAAGDAGLPVPRDGGRVSRRTRAGLLLHWSSIWRISALGAVFVAERLLDEPWPVMLGLVVVLLVALFAIGTALERWHRRS